MGRSRPQAVTVLHLGRNGGGPKFTWELADALAAEGVRVSSVVAELADNRHRYEALGPVLAVSTFRGAAGALVRSPLAISHAFEILRFVRRNRSDVVVVAMEQIWQVPVVWLLRLSGRPIYVCVHDASMHPGDDNHLERVLRWAQRRFASGFVAFSDHVATHLASRFRGRPVVRTVHGAFSAGAPGRRPPGDGRTPVVGFFGRLSAYKGLGLGYSAVSLLREGGRDVVFRVVASGDDPALAAMRHEDDDLRTGWTADEDVPAVLAGFDVLLLPYTEASQSGVLAYALGAALPGVVTPVGGLIEQAMSSGAALVAEAVTPEALASALRRLLDDETLYSDLAAAARRAAAGDFAWSRVARDLLDGIAAPATPLRRSSTVRESAHA